LFNRSSTKEKKGAPLSPKALRSNHSDPDLHLRAPQTAQHQSLLNLILATLDDAKAENIVTIDLTGKTSIGDAMVVASGRSQRHVGAVADQLIEKLKANGVKETRVEGLPHCDWVLIDAGDVIVHVFRPEVREFYNIEKMWSASRPSLGIVS
jgi:ribosome-associated protein